MQVDAWGTKGARFGLKWPLKLETLLLPLHTVSLKVQNIQTLAVLKLLCLYSGLEECEAAQVKESCVAALAQCCSWAHWVPCLSAGIISLWLVLCSPFWSAWAEGAYFCLPYAAQALRVRAMLQADFWAFCLVDQVVTELRSTLHQVSRQEPEPKAQPANSTHSLGN